MFDFSELEEEERLKGLKEGKRKCKERSFKEGFDEGIISANLLLTEIEELKSASSKHYHHLHSAETISDLKKILANFKRACKKPEWMRLHIHWIILLSAEHWKKSAQFENKQKWGEFSGFIEIFA